MGRIKEWWKSCKISGHNLEEIDTRKLYERGDKVIAYMCKKCMAGIFTKLDLHGAFERSVEIKNVGEKVLKKEDIVKVLKGEDIVRVLVRKFPGHGTLTISDGKLIIHDWKYK